MKTNADAQMASIHLWLIQRALHSCKCLIIDLIGHLQQVLPCIGNLIAEHHCHALLESPDHRRCAFNAVMQMLCYG